MIRLAPRSEKGDSDRNWNDRKETAEEVRKRLRRGWRYDSGVLSQYFQSCYNNWKVYTGPRTPQQVIKLQAIYKQAIYGDNHEPQPEDLHSVEGQKWEAWYKFKGMPSEMAKRRFITFLSEIDQSLIDVMPDERPPVGFPLDRKGMPICAKCNTTVGCSRPLLDQRKMNLRVQLFEHEELHEPEKLKEWIRNALANQRCVWGMHMPISKAEAKPFTDWFNREENRGFYPYDSISLMDMVRDLVEHYHEVVYDMMQHKAEVDHHVYNDTATKTLKLKEILESFSGEPYHFELLCTRKNESCDMRRIADGGRNHKHEVIIDPPTASNANTMEEAIALRTQCQRLGINPCTGVVKSIEERCNIYRERIAKHLEALQKAEEAKVRNENRATIHRQEKELVLDLSREMLQRQCAEACNANQIDHILTLVRRGCDPNGESQRGLTPMLCLVINEVPGERMEELLKRKTDMNRPNRHGMTPLLLAARMKDVRSVHVLMKNGAIATQKGMRQRTALHLCAIHHSEEVVRVIVDYLKEGIGDSMRVVRFLDAVDDEGETALIVAASARNGLMCHLLLSLGVNANIRNRHGRTAAHAARHHGWTEIADWLERKMGAGAMKVETYADIQFEKQSRFGYLKTKELIQQFGKLYLLLVHNRLTLHPLGCPFHAQKLIEDQGHAAKTEQRSLVDNHQRYLLHRGIEDFPSVFDLKAVPSEEEQAAKRSTVAELKRLVEDMYKLVQQGYTYPNTESAAQPLPWTPLMCAVVLSDTRIIRLLVREGADANYPNKEGMTAVMLAAQLQDVDSLLELLHHRGDIEQVDNQGYSAQAYASSLPLPTFMEREMVEVVLEDEIQGAKACSTMDVIKLAGEMPMDQMREIVLKRQQEAAPECVEQHMQLMNLLSQYGLSTMSHAQNVFHHMKTLSWRLAAEKEADQRKEEEKYEEGEEGEREGSSSPLLLEDASSPPSSAGALVRSPSLRASGLPGSGGQSSPSERDRASNASQERPRCPLCTLRIPCAHFFKIESLNDYLVKEGLELLSNGTYASLRPNSRRGKNKVKGGYKSSKKLKVKNRIQELLEETDLADRHTDRSVTLAKKYQNREEALEKDYRSRLEASRPEQAKWLEISFGQSEQAVVPLLLNGEEEKEESEGEAKQVDDSTPSNAMIPFPTQEAVPTLPPDGLQDLQVVPVDSGASTEGMSTALVVAASQEEREASMAVVLASTPMDDSDGNKNSLALVSILKPSTEMVVHEPPASRKVRRVKFAIPGDLASSEEGEGEGDEEERETTGSPPLLLLTAGGEQEHQEDEEKERSEPSEERVEAVAGSNPSPPPPLQLLLPPKEETGEGSNPSGTTSSTSSTPPPSALSPARLSQDVKNAILVLQAGETAFKDAPPAAPSSPPRRRLMLFTQQPIFAASPSHPLHPQHPSPFSPRPPLPTLSKVLLSGWLYVHLAPLEANLVPCETLTITQSAWCVVLQHLEQCLQSWWREPPSLSRTTQINGRTWQVEAPRCLLCGIFYVRHVEGVQAWKTNATSYLEAGQAVFLRHLPSSPDSTSVSADLPLEAYLCLPCLLRKEVFHKISQALPRAVRKTFPTQWPVLSPSYLELALDGLHRSIVHSRQSADRVLALELAHANRTRGQRNRKDLRTPLTSSSLLQLEYLESRPSSRVFSPVPSLVDSVLTNSTNPLSALTNDFVSRRGGFAAGRGEEDDTATFSSFSAATNLQDHTLKPKEMQMLVYLLYKEHYEEAERTVRTILGKCSINEGEGLLHTFQLLCLQADMYKCLGLSSLAMAIYLDLVDISCGLVGISNRIAHRAVRLVMINYHRLHCSEESEFYMAHFLEKMHAEMRGQMGKEDVVRAFKQTKREVESEILVHNAVYLQFIVPFVEGSAWIKSRYLQVLGVAAVYSMCSSLTPHIILLRRAFFAYCREARQAQPVFSNDWDVVGLACGFVEVSFRIRLVDDEDLRRMLVQHLLHKYLEHDSPLLSWLQPASLASPKSALLPPSPKSGDKTPRSPSKKERKKNPHTNSDLITSIKQYLSHGTEFPLPRLDPFLHTAMVKMVPYYAHFLVHCSEQWIANNEDVQMLVAEAMDIAATMIQCRIRVKLARRRVGQVRGMARAPSKRVAKKW